MSFIQDNSKPGPKQPKKRDAMERSMDLCAEAILFLQHGKDRTNGDLEQLKGILHVSLTLLSVEMHGRKHR